MARVEYWGDTRVGDRGDESTRHLMRILTRILNKVSDSYKKSHC
jgi:hypothetical protein